MQKHLCWNSLYIHSIACRELDSIHYKKRNRFNMTRRFILRYMALFLIIPILLIIPPAYAFDSPLKQIQSGVAIEEIQCNGDLVLVVFSNSRPACVKETTAQKLGLDIIPPYIPKYNAPELDVQSDTSLLSNSTGTQDIVDFDANINTDNISSDITSNSTTQNILELDAQSDTSLLSNSTETHDTADFDTDANTDSTSSTMTSNSTTLDILDPYGREPTTISMMFAGDVATFNITKHPGLPEHIPPYSWETAATVSDTIADILGHTKYGERSELHNRITYGFSDSPSRIVIHTNTWVGGIEYFSWNPGPVYPEKQLEYITHFMDGMGYENWGIWDHWTNTRKSTYTLINGQPTGYYYTAEEYAKIQGKNVKAMEEYIEIYGATSYALQKIDWNGIGRVHFIFDGSGGTVINVGSWDNGVQTPPVLLSKSDAWDRAVKYALTNKLLQGPQCSIILDEKPADNDKDIILDQVWGTKFWVTKVGSCSSPDLKSNYCTTEKTKKARDGANCLAVESGAIERDVIMFVDATDGKSIFFHHGKEDYTNLLD